MRRKTAVCVGKAEEQEEDGAICPDVPNDRAARAQPAALLSRLYSYTRPSLSRQAKG
jgi:hypothetical protein